MQTINTLEADAFTDFLSDFCGTRIETVGDLIRVAVESGLQPSDVLNAATNLYQQGRTINGA